MDHVNLALDYSRQCLDMNTRNLEVRHLKAKIFENLGNFVEAES